MSFSYGRSGRSQFARRQPQRFNRSIRSARIHPSKYINHAAEMTQEAVHISQHAFSDFGLHPLILENITRHGYTQPTPIQDQAIPHIMQGRDLVGIANTGTGKTAVFLLPLIHRMLEDNSQGAIIVVPTRELAVQIEQELKIFVQGMRIGMALCVGGLSIQPQIQHLRKNPHFVIGTPGRLKDLIMRGSLDLSKFTNVVLDEVDRMLDIGFINDIRFLVDQLPVERSSYFFSATMTREVETIMQSFLNNPVQVSVKTKETSAQIHQDIVKIQGGQSKTEVLYELLQQEEFEKVIVFGRTKHGINKLEALLTAKGIKVSSIHGNKAQGARQRSLELFKRGAVQALLATDVAARGIDIAGVTHVINFDEPNSFEDYVHRIGRTGRAGNAGKALTFIG